MRHATSSSCAAAWAHSAHDDIGGGTPLWSNFARRYKVKQVSSTLHRSARSGPLCSVRRLRAGRDGHRGRPLAIDSRVDHALHRCGTCRLPGSIRSRCSLGLACLPRRHAGSPSISRLTLGTVLSRGSCQSEGREHRGRERRPRRREACEAHNLREGGQSQETRRCPEDGVHQGVCQHSIDSGPSTRLPEPAGWLPRRSQFVAMTDHLIHLVCGSTGAGKTTYARALSERIGAVRFSIDEWMTALF